MRAHGANPLGARKVCANYCAKVCANPRATTAGACRHAFAHSLRAQKVGAQVCAGVCAWRPWHLFRPHLVPTRQFFPMPAQSLSSVVFSMCTNVNARSLKAWADLTDGRQRALRVRLAQHAVRAILGDGDIEVRQGPGRIVYLRGGCATPREDSELCPEAKEALRVVRLGRIMQMSWRQIYQMPRHCPKSALRICRAKYIPYLASPLVVKSGAAPSMSGAVAPLAEIVRQQIVLAETLGTPPLDTPKIWVILAADATPLWKSSATRCDVHVAVWGGGPTPRGPPGGGLRGGLWMGMMTRGS